MIEEPDSWGIPERVQGDGSQDACVLAGRVFRVRQFDDLGRQKPSKLLLLFPALSDLNDVQPPSFRVRRQIAQAAQADRVGPPRNDDDGIRSGGHERAII